MNPPDTSTLPSNSATDSKALVNDLSIQMATANGTGSQSANNILAKTLFRMGIPVGAKNLFPSNIQGLPTWFTIRVSGRGYTARKKELDWLVAMNPDTWEQDVAELRPGAVVLYNSDELPSSVVDARDDLIAYPVPITKLVKDNVKAAKLRKMLANVIYVGALAELLSFDKAVLDQVICDTFSSKPKAIEVNQQCAALGMQYVREQLEKRDPFRVQSLHENDGKMLVDGNTMAGFGCVMGGCTVVTWYPITPSSSLCESFIEHARKFRVDAETGEHRFADVQAEDELASIGMVLGAGWAGARAMTATAGPGISLMNELIGFGYYAEIPGVIFDVQRLGPSTGLPTRNSQGDLTEAYYCSHGDTMHPCLIPCDPAEAYEFARISFDFAERLQTPVFVLSDLDLGMNFWITDKPNYPTGTLDRGKVLSAQELDKLEKWGRYADPDGDGIPYRTLPGNESHRASYFTRGSGHDENAAYSEDHDVWQRNMERLARKIDRSRKMLPAAIEDRVADARIAVVAYGTTHAAMHEARDQLQAQQIKTSYLRVRALPMDLHVMAKLLEDHDRVYIVEQNRDGQLEQILRNEIRQGRLSDRLRSVRHYNGLPIDARTISDSIHAQEGSQS